VKDILIIENNPGDILLLQESFAQLNSTGALSVVSDGEEAREMLQSDESIPEYIFIDIDIPKVSGVELLEHVRQDATFDNTLVVFWTSLHNPISVEQLRSLGADYVYVKPMDFHGMNALIHEVLEKGHSAVRSIKVPSTN